MPLAKYKIHDKHEMLVCPFDKLHLVEAYRFHGHLMKCQKSHKDMKLVHCDFNYCHMVAPQELRHHHTVCPDRARIEYDLAPTTSDDTSNSDLFLNDDDDNIVHSEDWGDTDRPTELMVLGGDGFKPVKPKSKPKEKVDVEGWLARQSNPVVADRDVNWEPPAELRLPKTTSRALAGGVKASSSKTHKNPQRAVPGVGRGHSLSVRTVPQDLLQLGRSHSRGPSSLVTEPPSWEDSSDSSGPVHQSPKAQRLTTPGGSPAGRGRGGSSADTGRGSSPAGRGRAAHRANGERQPPGINDSQNSKGTNRSNVKTTVPAPKGLSRIAASLGQPRPAVGRGAPLQETMSQNGLDSNEKQKLIRKYKKKLSEIQILQKQEKLGMRLHWEEQNKVQMADFYREQLKIMDQSAHGPTAVIKTDIDG